MRKPKISKITEVGKTYEVYITSENRFTFKSKRNANAFLGKFNKFLNAHISNSNQSLIRAFGIYRNYYQLLPKSLSRSIDSAFQSIEKSIDLCLSNGDSPNGNTFSYVHLKNVYQELEYIIDLLLTKAQARTDTPLIYQLKSEKSIMDSFFKDYDKIELEYKIEVQIIKMKISA